MTEDVERCEFCSRTNSGPRPEGCWCLIYQPGCHLPAARSWSDLAGLMNMDRAKMVDLFETFGTMIFENENYHALSTMIDVPRVLEQVCTVIAASSTAPSPHRHHTVLTISSLLL